MRFAYCVFVIKLPFLHPSCRLKKIRPASFRETCQWLKFPLNGLRSQSRVSPVVGLLSLVTGPEQGKSSGRIATFSYRPRAG